ncbi:MAG TPA: glycosyl transferase [Xanthobacteraceae bacterium]|jgi:UDP-N-acetylmuramyl pentapeptide phosphotransferase/UDP-N-acetylglucosamine-1-phosphate transferase
MSSVVVALLITALTALASAAAILLLYPVLKRYALARPNARSSHVTPTPQGAGIAVIVTVAAASAVAFGFHAFPGDATAPLAIIIGAALTMACVGAIDDIRPLPVVPRLLLQAAIVAAVIFTLPTELRILPALPFGLERLILLVGGLWFVNLVNFMDGIDWITAAETIPVAATLALLAAAHAIPAYAAFVAVTLGGAVLGFAYFNRPIARVFLGDVGSLPIGLVLGWLLILLAANGHLAAAVLMPLYYLADASVTLLRRLIQGKRVWQAHRTHFYQIATERGFSVREIVARVLLLNLCLCGLAAATVFAPAPGRIIALVVGFGLVGALLFIFARGKPSTSG